jgi:hypothetical protein
MSDYGWGYDLKVKTISMLESNTHHKSFKEARNAFLRVVEDDKTITADLDRVTADPSRPPDGTSHTPQQMYFYESFEAEVSASPGPIDSKPE